MEKTTFAKTHYSGTCEYCEPWIGTRQKPSSQIAKEVGEHEPFPCPHCGGTEWAKQVPTNPPERYPTCEFCEGWVAATWSQYNRRRENMARVPTAAANICPKCGTTNWLNKEPQVPRPNWTPLVTITAVVILVVALVMLGLSYRALAQTTFRDASGRQTGTATRDSNGTTTFRDGAGRQTGTASTNSNGTTTFRDGSGRMTGTAERRR